MSPNRSKTRKPKTDSRFCRIVRTVVPVVKLIAGIIGSFRK